MIIRLWTRVEGRDHIGPWHVDHTLVTYWCGRSRGLSKSAGRRAVVHHRGPVPNGELCVECQAALVVRSPRPPKVRGGLGAPR